MLQEKCQVSLLGSSKLIGQVAESARQTEQSPLQAFLTHKYSKHLLPLGLEIKPVRSIIIR